jgi:hypothetical protein
VKGPGWARSSDVVTVVRRRWESGKYLRAYARGEEWAPIVIPVKGPTSEDLLNRFEDVRKWAAAFEAESDRALHIEYRKLGGRHFGANQVPARVQVRDFDSLCALLGTTDVVKDLDMLLARTKAEMPSLLEWATEHPLLLLEHRDVWPRVLATIEWIAGRDTGRTYVRQIDAEGVDTKFVERHQKLLAELLTIVLPPERVETSEVEFSRRFRFLDRPLYTRLRILDPRSSPFPPAVTEVSLRTDELACLDLQATTVFVVENEITYLALPPIAGSVAVFGGGFASVGLAGLPWLRDREVVYWGDIDTYGFEILSRLRGHLPHVRSILMDRETLLFHRQHWSTETSPTRRPLPHLTDAEQSLYQDLISDVYGAGVRLEQERVRFSRVQNALSPWTRATRSVPILRGPGDLYPTGQHPSA